MKKKIDLQTTSSLGLQKGKRGRLPLRNPGPYWNSKTHRVGRICSSKPGGEFCCHKKPITIRGKNLYKRTHRKEKTKRYAFLQLGQEKNGTSSNPKPVVTHNGTCWLWLVISRTWLEVDQRQFLKRNFLILLTFSATLIPNFLDIWIMHWSQLDKDLLHLIQDK